MAIQMAPTMEVNWVQLMVWSLDWLTEIQMALSLDWQSAVLSARQMVLMTETYLESTSELSWANQTVKPKAINLACLRDNSMVIQMVESMERRSGHSKEMSWAELSEYDLAYRMEIQWETLKEKSSADLWE